MDKAHAATRMIPSTSAKLPRVMCITVRGRGLERFSNRLGLLRNEGTIRIRMETVFNIKAMLITVPCVMYLRLNFADSPRARKMKIAI